MVTVDRQSLIEDYITERIGQITEEMDPDLKHEYYKEQDAILQSMDKENQTKFEDLIDSLVAWNSEECRAVYKEAFLEGLRLGHKAFQE